MTYFEELLAKAKQGNAKAQFRLGCLYYCGRGIKKEEVKAFYWWRKAVKQNYLSARLLLNYYTNYNKKGE